MNRNQKNKAHKGENHAQFKKADAKIGKQFAKKQPHGADRGNEKLLERTALFFSNDRKSREKRGDVEEQDGGQAGQKEIRRARVGIKENFRSHVHRERSGAVLENAAQRFIEADGGGDIDGLAGYRGIGAVNEHQDLGAHLVEKAVGIVDGNLDAHARAAGDDGVVEVLVVLHIADNVKRVGIFQAVQQFPTLLAAVGVVNDGMDLANVGVDREAKNGHLEQRNNQRKKQGRRIPANVQDFLVKDGGEAAEDVSHWRPPEAPDACR